MAYYAAQGTSPVVFVDANQSQRQFPLSEVYITPNGLDASLAPLYSANSSSSPSNKEILDALLPRLVSGGYLTPGSSPLTLTMTAVQAGLLQCSIQASFQNATDTGLVDMTVTASQTAAGIAPGGLTAVLGSSAAKSTSLAWVSDTESSKMPAVVSQQAIGASLAVQTEDNSETAFTLEPTLAGADAQLVQVAVSQDPSGSTFTVTLSWTKTQTGITMASLLSHNPFSYLVTFSGAGGPPPVATITLSGGTAASGSSPATSASASIYA
jgi:hypothetical protein